MQWAEWLPVMLSPVESRQDAQSNACASTASPHGVRRSVTTCETYWGAGLPYPARSSPEPSRGRAAGFRWTGFAWEAHEFSAVTVISYHAASTRGIECAIWSSCGGPTRT